MSNDAITKLILLASFIGFLFVMVFDMVTRPDAMVPTIVSGVVFAILGYAAHAQGVDLGTMLATKAQNQTADLARQAQQQTANIANQASSVGGPGNAEKTGTSVGT